MFVHVRDCMYIYICASVYEYIYIYMSDLYMYICYMWFSVHVFIYRYVVYLLGLSRLYIYATPFV
jgi:hypothetical protein